MYRSAELRTYQYFVSPDWPGACPLMNCCYVLELRLPSGGVYASPAMAGSRYTFPVNHEIALVLTTLVSASPGPVRSLQGPGLRCSIWATGT